jgi:hypothetical protein
MDWPSLPSSPEKIPIVITPEADDRFQEVFMKGPLSRRVRACRLQFPARHGERFDDGAEEPDAVECCSPFAPSIGSRRWKRRFLANFAGD